jgi:hypothetical protein
MTKRGTIRETGNVGDKLIPKLTHAIRDTMIATKKAMLPWEHHVRVKATQDIIDRIGHEIADHYGPFVDRILEADDGTLSPETRQFLLDSRSGEHQLKAVTGLVMGPVSGAISLLLSNELAPLVYQLVGSNPHLVFDPQTAANAAAQRVASSDTAQLDMAKQGYGGDQQAQLIELARSYPQAADAIDMFRRGHISQAQLILALERNAVPSQYIEAYVKSANVPLSLADAALAYLRSDITLDEARQIAHDNGYTNEQLDVFVGNTGEPLGLEQMLEGLRREFVNEETVVRGIKQSRIRNEWIPLALKLRFTPMSVADAVNAVVQNHLSMADAQKISDQNGLEPSHFPVLTETAGEPLSRTEMEDLYNRNLVTEDDVKQALRESRVKNKYIDDAFKLHVKLLEPRILSSAVEFGAISHADAIKRAMAHGLSADDAAILVNEGSARKLKTYRERVVSAAEGLYEENAITHEEFTKIAQAMGFESQEAEFIYQSAEYRRQAKAVTGVINSVRSKFVGHHIAKGEATGFLDALGLPAAQRNYLIGLWQIESEANVRNLTTAQVVKAVKMKLITPQDGLARLRREGYNETDAELLLKGA